MGPLSREHHRLLLPRLTACALSQRSGKRLVIHPFYRRVVGRVKLTN